jgi:hypothetical protein
MVVNLLKFEFFLFSLLASILDSDNLKLVSRDSTLSKNSTPSIFILHKSNFLYIKVVVILSFSFLVFIGKGLTFISLRFANSLIAYSKVLNPSSLFSLKLSSINFKSSVLFSNKYFQYFIF